MNHFFIIANPEKEESLAAAEQVAAYIARRGGDSVLRLREASGSGKRILDSPGSGGSNENQTPGLPASGGSNENHTPGLPASGGSDDNHTPGLSGNSAGGKNSGLGLRDTSGAGVYLYTDPAQVPQDTECIIVVGGDGTLLQAAGDLYGLHIPFIGVNYGTLGYLAEIDRAHVDSMVDRLMADKYTTEERMMLEGRVLRGGKVIAENVALNDIVVTKSGLPKVLEFPIRVNGSVLTTYLADGILLSTPTGSTAYNMSAGGPIVEPQAELILLTPICPHTLNNRSIIFSKEDEITITMPERERRGGEVRRYLSFDGTRDVELIGGDKLIITKASQAIRLAKIRTRSFLDVLQRKMNQR